MKFALSMDQLAQALAEYLIRHNHELPIGDHEIEVFDASSGNARGIVITFTRVKKDQE